MMRKAGAKTRRLVSQGVSFDPRAEALKTAALRVSKLRCTIPAMKDRDEQANYRYQGIAAALAELAGSHMEPGLAIAVLESLGVTMVELEAAGADPYDLDMLKGAPADANPLQHALGELAQNILKGRPSRLLSTK